MKQIAFSKMHGLGNDFIIIHDNDNIQLTSSDIVQLSNRHTGIGFDQLLLVTQKNPTTLYCDIYNADGSKAEQCGNGLRCVAWWAKKNNLISENTIIIETCAGQFPVTIKNQQQITLMIPHTESKITTIAIDSISHSIDTIHLGNPHAMIRVEKINLTEAEKNAAIINKSTHFPLGVNVGFMQIIDPQHIRLLTIERGAGKTYACGSNACAAALIGIERGWLQSPIQVEFELGSVIVSRHEADLQLTGPAEWVYEGILRTDRRIQ